MVAIWFEVKLVRLRLDDDFDVQTRTTRELKLSLDSRGFNLQGWWGSTFWWALLSPNGIKLDSCLGSHWESLGWYKWSTWLQLINGSIDEAGEETLNDEMLCFILNLNSTFWTKTKDQMNNKCWKNFFFSQFYSSSSSSSFIFFPFVPTDDNHYHHWISWW